MYICICNAVTEKQVHQAAANGARSLDDLHNLLAVGSQCGSCRECAHQCLREAHASLPSCACGSACNPNCAVTARNDAAAPINLMPCAA